MSENTLTVTVTGRDELSGELKKIESGVIRFVGAVSSALAALSVIAFPVLDAARFQRELLEAAKTTNYSKDQIDELKAGLEELSTQINVTAVDLAKIATMGGQLGIGSGGAVGALLTFTEEVARAVTALDVSAEEAVASLGKLINIFNIPASQFRNVISSLNEVSNSSNATASELFDVVRRIGDLGGAVNVPDAAAISATMIDLGLTAETAGTTITKIFADMRASAEDFAAFVGNGMTVERWVGLLQGQGLKALDLFLDRLNELPQNVAAAAQIQMVGGGRISEAISKLRTQRRNAVELEKVAEAELLALQARRVGLTKEEADAADAYVARLKEAAVNANKLASLQKAATDAYASGDSAMKEQQTVLSGLSAQWQVFINNVTKASRGVGDALLLPLTEGLRGLSSAMQDANLGEELGDGVRETIEVFKELTSRVSYFAGGLADIDWDFGSLLQVGALIAAKAAFSLLGGAVTALGAALLTASPMLARVSTALFGTTVAAQAARQEAAAAATALAASQQRVGGVFNSAANATAGFANKLAAIDTLNRQIATNQQRVVQITGQVTQAQNTLAAAYTNVGRRLQTRAALEASVAAIQARIAAGQNVGRNTNELARQQAVLNVVRAMETRIQRLIGLQAALGARTQQTNAQIAQMSTGAVGAARAFMQAKAAGDSMAVAFTKAIMATNAGASGAGAFARISSAFVSAKAAVTSFGASLVGAFARGQAGVVGMTGTLAGLRTMLATLGVQMRTVFGAGLNTVLGSIASRLGHIALGAAGMGAAWEAAASRMTRSAVVAATAVSLLAKAVGKVKSLLLSFVNFAFFALLIKEGLELIGVWDDVLEVIARTYEFFGGSRAKLPEWLQAKTQLKQTTKEIREIEEAYASLQKAASAYTQETASLLLLLGSKEAVASKLSYDERGPEVIGEVAAATELLLAAEAKLLLAQKEKAELSKAEIAQGLAVAKARQQLANNLGGSGEAYARDNLAEQEASHRKLTAALRERQAIEASLATDLPRAYSNVAASIVSAEDALLQYNLEGRDGVRTLQQYTDAMGAYLRAMAEVQRKQEEGSPADRAPTGKGGQAAAEEYRTSLATMKTAAEDAKKTVDSLQQKMYEFAPNNLAFRKWVDSVRNANAPAAVEAMGRSMAAALSKGMSSANGRAVPKLKPQDLLEAGTTLIVSQQMKTLYEGLAATARANAEKAKNAMTNALEDSARAAKAAAAALREIGQALDQNRLKAQNYKADQKLDGDLRKRLSNLDIEYNKERELIEMRHKGNATRLAEEMFALEETFRKRREKEQQLVDLKKGQRDAEQQVGGLDKLVAEANKYLQVIQEANKVLNDPASTEAQRTQAINDRTNAEKEAKAAAEAAGKAISDIAKLPPVGDKFVIDPGRVESMAKAVTDLGPKITAALQESAPALEAYYKSQATNFDKLAAQEKLAIDGATASLEQWARLNGVSTNEAILKWTELAAKTREYSSAMEELGKLTATIKYTPELFSEDAIKEQVKGLSTRISEALNNTKNTTISIPLTADQTKLKESIAATMTSILAQKQPPTVPVAVSASADSKTAMANDISTTVAPSLTSIRASEEAKTALKTELEESVKPKITVDVNARYLGMSGGGSGGQAGRFARGGYIGGLKSFATGGKVSGAGTGTSDSILSWLSNGEYVIDAMTTARFGSKFFAMLQALARGGTSTSFLTKMASAGIPRFATGGPVGVTPSGILPVVQQVMTGGNENPTGMVKRDVVDVNLNVGGKKLSLFAERQQAAELVKTLKSMEAGA